MKGGDSETRSSCNIYRAHAMRMGTLSRFAHEHSSISRCCSCRISSAWHVLCSRWGKSALFPVQLVLNEMGDIDM